MIFHYSNTLSEPLPDCPLQIYGPLALKKSSESNFWYYKSKKRKRKWKSGSTKFRCCPIVSQTRTTFNLSLKTTWEIQTGPFEPALSTEQPSCVSRGSHVIHDIGHFMRVSGRGNLSISKAISRYPSWLYITDLWSHKLVFRGSLSQIWGINRKRKRIWKMWPRLILDIVS